MIYVLTVKVTPYEHIYKGLEEGLARVLIIVTPKTTTDPK